MEHCAKEEVAVKRELSRLVQKQEIINLRKGFYLIIPPRYSMAQKLPVQLYAEKLFESLKRKYYIGLFSAARLHGAGHQQPQRDYVLIEAPKLNTIRRKAFDLHFFTTSTWPSSNIHIARGEAGNYHISSPALTFFDLIHHHRKLGGMNRIAPVLEELIEGIREKDLIELLEWYPHKSTLQRVGFILEMLDEAGAFPGIILDRLRKEPFYPVLLSPRQGEKPGSAPNPFKVDVNVKMEFDS